MIIQDIFKEESDIPHEVISDIFETISKNEQTWEHSIRNTHAYQRLRMNFIASIRQKLGRASQADEHNFD